MTNEYFKNIYIILQTAPAEEDRVIRSKAPEQLPNGPWDEIVLSFFKGLKPQFLTKNNAPKKWAWQQVSREITLWPFLQFQVIIKPISRSAAFKYLRRAQSYMSFSDLWLSSEHEENPDMGLRISSPKKSHHLAASESAHSNNGLHWEDVSSSCEYLPGCEEHMCVF